MRKKEEKKMSVRILIENREYTSWTFQDSDTNLECPRTGILANIDPVKHRLFSKDVFRVSPMESSEDINIKMVHSLVRTATSLAGVLQLHDNKTYGRTPNNRLLYKCIPDDKRLPAFLVPYDQKIGFSKTAMNKYIIFRFFRWENTEKHPCGIIEETLGNVDSLDAFYEYQLYCKSLHTSITTMTHNARIALNRKTNGDYVEQIRRNPDFQIRDYTSDYVFTIDPPNSLDFDDGFSILPYPDPGQPTKFVLRIYIANVYVWLETLSLWNSFSQRVSTIYLPDRRRPMLPTVLSDALCSLQEGHDRFAFVMEIVVDLSGETVQEEVPRFYNANIRVAKNYRYEEPDLLRDPHYEAFLEATQCLDKFDRKSGHTTIANSHDLVAFWMIRMNCYCGRELAEKKTGIFRSAVFTDPGAGADDDSPNTPALSEDTRRVIRMWNNTTGQYLAYSESAILSHELMNVNTYIHITSPIRRLVDLLNQMIFCSTLLNISLSTEAIAFLVEWIKQMDYLNTTMRSIRKVQTDCDILTRCVKDPNIMSGVHEGVMFDRMVKSDGSISYMVYLEKWKILSRITTRRQDLPNYSRAEFNIFLFEEEDMTRRKIRLYLIDSGTSTSADAVEVIPFVE